MLENETLRRQANTILLNMTLIFLHFYLHRIHYSELCVFADLLLQVEELRCLFPLTEHVAPTYLQYQHMERKNVFVDNGVKCPNLASNCANEKGDSDTALHLGYYAFLFPNN